MNTQPDVKTIPHSYSTNTNRKQHSKPSQKRITFKAKTSSTSLRADRMVKYRPQVVTEFPNNPDIEGHYVFANQKRASLTNFNHGLHKYPAKFIPQIARWGLLYNRNGPREVVLDPFCGSGSTLVESGLQGNHSVGVDISPLAVLITQAKTSILRDVANAPNLLNEILSCAVKNENNIAKKLRTNSDSLQLHFTWPYWFRNEEMARLLALRDAVKKLTKPPLSNLLFATLSSVSKSCSYLNEDQIKVRYDHDKIPANPYEVFPKRALSAMHAQLQLTQLYRNGNASFEVHRGTAAKLPIKSDSVDRIVTSPPYINAVDYTMCHKYNMFILGMLEPENFKDHCREYIGVTERAVRSKDLISKPVVGLSEVDEIISVLWDKKTPLSRNRAYVAAQYFAGMYNSLKEVQRVLKRNGQAIFVIGEENRLCGVRIKTARLVEKLAHESGLRTSISFYHHLSNLSSMRLNRSETGGKVQMEAIYVFTHS